MWTDVTVQLLRDLWAKGFSASLIGSQLGCTRNAVIGKANRLGLEERTTRHVAARGCARRSSPRGPRAPRAPRERKAIRRRGYQHPQRTRSELYAMLAQAVRNTIAIQA